MSKKGKKGSELEKALKLLEIVCLNKKFSAQLLAKQLNVSPRTGRRYIKKLRDIFDTNIECNEGEYHWKHDVTISEKISGNPDLRLIYAFALLGKKLGSNQVFWDNFIRNIPLSDFGEKNLNKIIYESTIDYEKIGNIKSIIESAIKNSYAVKFKYSKYNKYYTVEPYQIILNRGLWYLLCVDKNTDTAKTFSLGYMENLKIIKDEPFEKIKKGKKILPLAEKAESIWQIGTNENLTEVVIEVDSDISVYFKEKNFFYNQKILEEQKNNNLKIKFSVHNNVDFKTQIIGWIPFVRVIEPDEYKKYYIDILEEALEFQQEI